MKPDDTKSKKNTACQCPMCTSTPAPTYTREYMMECLVRWYAAQPQYVRDQFIAIRKQKFGGDAGLKEVKDTADRLGIQLDL